MAIKKKLTDPYRSDRMDKRRANLRLYMRESRIEQRSIARKLNISESQLSQHLSGRRPFGEDLARRIELAEGLTQGWLDQEQRVPGAPEISPAEQAAAAARYEAKSATARQLAKEYGVPETTIYQWVAAAKRQASMPAHLAGADSERLANLERENRDLKDRLLRLLLKQTDES